MKSFNLLADEETEFFNFFFQNFKVWPTQITTLGNYGTKRMQGCF